MSDFILLWSCSPTPSHPQFLSRPLFYCKSLIVVFKVEAGEEVGVLKSKLFFQMSRSLGSQEPELGFRTRSQVDQRYNVQSRDQYRNWSELLSWNVNSKALDLLVAVLKGKTCSGGWGDEGGEHWLQTLIGSLTLIWVWEMVNVAYCGICCPSTYIFLQNTGAYFLMEWGPQVWLRYWKETMQFVLFWFSLSIETAVLLVSLESKQSESMLRIQLSTRDEMQITQLGSTMLGRFSCPSSPRTCFLFASTQGMAPSLSHCTLESSSKLST